MTTFTVDGKHVCPQCKTPKDVVLKSDAPGRYLSRHLDDEGGFCLNSLMQVSPPWQTD